MLIVLTTINMHEKALRLAKEIVENRLAACVQVLPRMTSIYIWEGKVQEEAEYFLLVKSSAEKYSELEAFIRKNHSYEIPEIVAIDVDRVSEHYRQWLEETIGPPA